MKRTLGAVVPGVSATDCNWIIGTLSPVSDHFEVRAGSKATLVVYSRRNSTQALYVWGMVAHPRLSGDSLWLWLLERIEERDHASFTELLGSFALIAFDPTSRRVSIVTDAIGSRPLFWRIATDGELILGSDTLVLKEHGLCGAALDYDAIAAWLMYGYNCTRRTLFGGLNAFTPAATTEFHLGHVRAFPYIRAEQGASISQADLPDRLFELVAESTRVWLREVPRITLPLSGGLDSRLLLALYCRERGADTMAYTLRFSDAEATTANAVAACLGLPWRAIDLGSSAWTFDFSPVPQFWKQYEGEYQVSADGFPIGKHPVYTLAFDHPDVPVMNGFLGDSLMRGSHDLVEGRRETDLEASEVPTAIQREFAAQAWVPLDLSLLGPGLSARVRDRALAPVEEIVREGAPYGRAVALTNLWLRQRFYISNNFLQHLDYAESILPFLSARLINLKLSNPGLNFSMETYRELFARHLPHISHIPHEREVHRSGSQNRRPNLVLMRWAAQELFNLLDQRKLRGLVKPRLVRRLLGGGHWPQQEYLLAMLRELSWLERFAAALNLPLNWDEL